MPDLVLTSVERNAPAFAEAVRTQLARGARGVAVLPDDTFAKDFFAHLPGVGPSDPQSADVLCLTHEHRPALEEALHSQLDRPGGAVVIGRLEGHGLNRPLFLISIPKAGTHLLYRLAEQLGFTPAVICPEVPSSGNWYCLEYSNSHTVPRDFFVDSVRRAPFGNRSHPFLSSAALFIVRHPWDILVSEANYYPKLGASALSGFYRDLGFDECVERLLSDDRLLGRFRDRILAFEPWLAFENVIPLAFEDLVGERGGGTAERQERLIWSIQLKLGVPGEPRKLAADLFDRTSPTFQEGQIGTYRGVLELELLQRLDSNDADVLRAFGYVSGEDPYTQLSETWRKQRLKCREDAFFRTPILLESDYLGHNFVQYAGRLYAIPQELGPVDLSRDKPLLETLPQANSLAGLRAAVQVRRAADQYVSQQSRASAQPEGDIAQLTESLRRRLGRLESSFVEHSRRISVLENAIENCSQSLLTLESALRKKPFRLVVDNDPKRVSKE